MTFEQGVSALRDFGLPTALLLAGCFAGWKWGWYILTEIVRPVAGKIIEFLEHLKTQVEKLVGSTDRMCEQMEKQGEKLDSHGDRLADHGRAIEEIRTMLKK